MNNSESLGVTFTYGNFGGKLCWATQIKNGRYIHYAPTLSKAVSSVHDHKYHIENVNVTVPYYKISAEDELDLIRYKCK